MNNITLHGTRAPLVTIAIPTYNRPEGLKHTLFCATRQSYTNLEIIVADNCSEPADKVQSTIKCFQCDTRIKYFRHDRNMGPYFNFNFLMERANGKYFIFFPDDDDYSDEHLIKQYVSALEEHPRAALAFATIQCIDGSGTVFEEDKPPYHLDGSLLHRFWTYLAFNITDHIMYGMFRTSSLCPYRFECDVPTPEKFLILHALAKGPMIDCYSTSYRNHYSFKSPDEIALLFERPPTRNHVLVWIRCAATKIRFPHSILVILLYLFLRAPKLSWPVRQLFGFPRAHPGRTCREPVKKKWKFE